MADIKRDTPFVLVRCITYNHEAYIEDALKGFVMQKTDFPFVVSIIDDASTDNNTSVIMDYLKRVCDADEVNPKIEEYGKVIDATPSNYPNCLLHVVLLNENHYGKKSKQPYYIQFEEKAKYIAMCEGDDYWTDPYKLQKQVDFMETHPDFSICFTRVKCLMNATSEMVDEFIVRDMPRESTIADLAHGNYIHTPSVLLRNSETVWAKVFSLGRCAPSDYVMWMFFAETGKIWKFEEPMAVYRVGSGIWSSDESINPDLEMLMTLNKLWMAIDDAEVKNVLQEQIFKQKQAVLDFVVHQKRDLDGIRSSKAYRLGKLLLKPFHMFKKH